jgi:hypothetical protein
MLMRALLKNAMKLRGRWEHWEVVRCLAALHDASSLL